MLDLAEFPELMEHYAPFFEGVFSPEALIQFKGYIMDDLSRKTKR